LEITVMLSLRKYQAASCIHIYGSFCSSFLSNLEVII